MKLRFSKLIHFYPQDLSKINLAMVLLLHIMPFSGCSNSKTDGQIRHINEENAMNLIREIVAIGSRPSGSKKAIQCVEYIKKKCVDYGYEPVVENWQEKTPRGTITFRNVYSILKGVGKNFVIIGSHYDTKRIVGASNFVGANDGASSTALLLEIMNVLRNSGPWKGPTLQFAFFDGEESVIKYSENDGLHGSRKLANSMKESGSFKLCKAMILLDMVGDKELTITISPDDDATLTNHLFSIAKYQGVQDHFGFFLHGTILDDHVPFKRLGIPSIDIIDFKYGQNNQYWHTELDTVDKLSPDSLKVVGDVVLQLLAEL